jgi:alkylation response protein AidB-like acyl-CoA dehydrogenase
MDFRPSPAQQLLVSTARDFLRRHCPIERAQALALDERGFDDVVWRRMAELGWSGLLVPPDLGGTGGSLLDVVLLVEEMGRAALPGPFIASAVVATSLLVAGGSPAQRARLLPVLAAGERIVTLALAEEGSPDPDRVAMACALPGRLTGTKLFVKDAHVADDLVVAVRHGGELALLLLPANRAGIVRRPLDAMSGEKLFAVEFDGVEVLPADHVGAPGHGRELLGAACRTGALARTAEMVGLAQRILELTVEHARTRVQGGRPIGGHQAIQHACADMVRDVDAARGLLHLAAWAIAEGSGETELAMAKAYAAEACPTVARRSHQILGAIGYCQEHPLPLLHTRIHAAALDFGDAAAHLDTVAQAIGLAPL